MTRRCLALLPLAWASHGCGGDKGSVDTGPGTGATGSCDQDDPPDCDDVSVPCSPLDEAPLILNGSEPDEIGGHDSYDQFGTSVAGGHDYDGDGVDDVAAASYGPVDADVGPGGTYALLVSGSRDGDLAWDDADLVVVGDTYSSLFVSFLPSQDGDGLDELLVGNLYHREGVDLPGAFFLFEGGLSGEVGLDAAAASVTGESAGGSAFGCAIDGCADVTGDGVPDVLVGDEDFTSSGQQKGSAYVVAGPITGEGTAESALAGWYGPDEGGAFGHALSCQGDVDGDGIDDVVVSDFVADADADGAGVVYVFVGPVSGWGRSSDADVVMQGAGEATCAGYDVAVVGDADGDGYDDLAVAAPGSDNIFMSGDAPQQWTYLVSGPPSSGSLDEAPARINEGVDSLSGVADVDGDGRDELLIGYTGLLNEYHEYCFAGSAWLFLGPLSGTYTSDDADQLYLSGVPGDSVGMSLADAGSREGGRNVIVGAWGYGRQPGNAYVLPALPSE